MAAPDGAPRGAADGRRRQRLRRPRRPRAAGPGVRPADPPRKATAACSSSCRRRCRRGCCRHFRPAYRSAACRSTRRSRGSQERLAQARSLRSSGTGEVKYADDPAPRQVELGRCRPRRLRPAAQRARAQSRRRAHRRGAEARGTCASDWFWPARRNACSRNSGRSLRTATAIAAKLGSSESLHGRRADAARSHPRAIDDAIEAAAAGRAQSRADNCSCSNCSRSIRAAYAPRLSEQISDAAAGDLGISGVNRWRDVRPGSG